MLTNALPNSTMHARRDHGVTQAAVSNVHLVLQKVWLVTCSEAFVEATLLQGRMSTPSRQSHRHNLVLVSATSPPAPRTYSQ